MKKGERLWTRDELILTMNLYCKLPFGKLHRGNEMVIDLARLIGRNPNAVAYKLVNLASLDPSIRESGRKGAENASKLDKEIWNEFYNNWDSLPFESEKLLAQYKNTTVEKLNEIESDDLPKEGIEKKRLVKVRVNQKFFRTAILAAYNNTCCITGINLPELVVAGHISKWSKDEKNRMNPRNGLAMNCLHDKAYENGLISITPNYIIKISKTLITSKNDGISRNFTVYHDKKIILPDRFLPNPEFLELHLSTRFVN